MTSFIGDGGVHQIPPAVVAQEAQQRVAQLRTSFANLAHQITHDVVLAILSALGLTPAQIAQLLHAVAGFEAFLANPIGYIQKYILPQGGPSSPQTNPISQLYTALNNGLHGLLPPVINNNDGTFAALGSSIVNNADGTLSYLGGEAHAFINNLDGTFSTFAGAVQQGFAGLEQQGANFITGVAGWAGNFSAAFTGARAPAAATPGQAFLAAQGVYSTTTANNQNIGGLSGLVLHNGNTVQSLNQALQFSGFGTSGGSSGTNVTLNFSSDANQSNMSGIFTQSTATLSSGSGAPITTASPSSVTQMGITGGDAAWQSSTTYGYDFEYYPTATTTDYQVVSMNVASLPTTTAGPISLIGRSNSTMGTCVIGFVSLGLARIGCYVSGSWTSLASASVSNTPQAGALYELVLGNSTTSNPYAFSLLCNGTQLVGLTDTSHISQLGSSNRFAGLGMENNNFAPGTSISPTVSAWGVADNAPPAQIGSGFRQYRVGTTNVSLVSGEQLIPGSFFDTNQWQTGDLTYASATNKLTISVAGWYLVKVSLFLPGADTTFNCGVSLYHNGSLVQQGQVFVNTIGGATVADSFIVYCAATDTLQPGVNSSVAGALITGEATGTISYFSVALMNCGTLS